MVELKSLDRDSRFEAITHLIENNRFTPSELDELTDACLHEELTDRTPWKVRNTDYPIFNDMQIRRRWDKEVGAHNLKYVPLDGVKIVKPGRRNLFKWERAYIDRTYRTYNEVNPSAN